MKHFTSKKLDAFTLTELLLVLAIIGILVLIALPDQSSVVSKAKAVEAKLQLEHAFALEKTYFFEHSQYSNDLKSIGYEARPLVQNGGAANYRIAIVSADYSSFVIRATAVVDFDQDGTFNVWEINEKKELKELTKD